VMYCSVLTIWPMYNF